MPDSGAVQHHRTAQALGQALGPGRAPHAPRRALGAGGAHTHRAGATKNPQRRLGGKGLSKTAPRTFR